MRQFCLWIVVVVSACAAPAASRFSAADSAAVRAAQDAFVDAWLRDDTTGVLALLDTGAVLLPAGRKAIGGHANVRGYWWPNDGSRTRITRFDWTADEVSGSGSLAYIRGISNLAWTYDKDTVHQSMTARSQSLVLLRRAPDGRWLIWRQMWSPAGP
jgi:ketosteroid isomerase-like protein